LRKKAEADLIIKNEQLNEAEIIGCFGHFDWNVKTNEVICSVGMNYLFEVPAGKQIKTYDDYLSFLTPEQREAEEKWIQHCIENKKYTEHFQEIVSDRGNRKIFLTRGVVILDDEEKIEKIICTSHDVTEIEINKQLLEQSRQTFKNAFDHSAIGIALVGTRGHWLNANKALCDILGYTKEELLQCTFQEITHPDDLEADLALVKQMLDKEIETYQMEKRYYKKDGSTVWALLSVSLVWQNNTPEFFVSQVVDITAKKHLAIELEKKNAELQKANNEQQNYITQINEFNRIIGHNLRGPASSLINMAEYLESSNNEDDRIFLLSKVKSTSLLIINTLNDLKEFIEIQLNDDKKFTASSFAQALQQSTLLLDEQIKETKAIINTDINVAEIMFPKIYLESIFYNILSNALKYRNQQGPPVITVTTSVAGDNILLSIADNGIGIDLEKYGKEIFKYRKVFHKGYESNGIGLFLTRNQVESCNGRIEVESTVNKGTAFYIFFQKN